MPNISVVDMEGKQVGTVDLSDSIFGIEPNAAVMHQVVLHGGVVFAPKPRDYRFTINKKERRLALKSALSVKAAESDIIVVDSIATDEYKTKKIVAMLGAIGADKKALIVLPEVDSKVIKSANNIPGVKTAQVNTINVYDILNADKLVIAKDAVSKIEEVYA